MKSYKKEVFEGRLNKRGIEIGFVDRIIHRKKSYGNVISLTGPAIQDHFLNYSRLCGKNCSITTVEINPRQVKKERMREEVKKFNKEWGTTHNLVVGDIEKKISQIIKDGYAETGKKFLYIDLDFCGSATTHLSKLAMIILAIKSDIDKMCNRFYITITFSLRNLGGRASWKTATSLVENYFQTQKNFVDAKLLCIEYYTSKGDNSKDRRSCPMATALFECNKK